MSQVITSRILEGELEKIQDLLEPGETLSGWVADAVRMRLNPPKKAPPIPKKPKTLLDVYVEALSQLERYAMLDGAEAAEQHPRTKAAIEALSRATKSGPDLLRGSENLEQSVVDFLYTNDIWLRV